MGILVSLFGDARSMLCLEKEKQKAAQMKLAIFTIVLDGRPWIEEHLPIFKRLKCDWSWIIVHGSSQNQGSTAWCQPQKARFSEDGTSEYLDSIKSHERKTLISFPNFLSKDDMVNTAIGEIEEPCVLMEVDADEIHTPENIDKIVSLFENDPTLGAIKMPCRYFVGPDLICVGDNCWSNKADEWVRAWRFEPGMKFITHEPPKLDRMLGRMMEKDESRKNGLTFDHQSYATEQQVKFKQDFYGYAGLINQWRALQNNHHWPVRLGRFFPFVDDKVQVIRVDRAP